MQVTSYKVTEGLDLPPPVVSGLTNPADRRKYGQEERTGGKGEEAGGVGDYRGVALAPSPI